MASNELPSTVVVVGASSIISGGDDNEAPPPNDDATALAHGSPNDAVAPGENRYFYEDEVFRYDANGRVRFGLVMETFDANNSDSEMTQSDVEDQLKKGEVRVVWHPRGSEVVMPETMVSSIYILYLLYTIACQWNSIYI